MAQDEGWRIEGTEEGLTVRGYEQSRCLRAVGAKCFSLPGISALQFPVDGIEDIELVPPPVGGEVDVAVAVCREPLDHHVGGSISRMSQTVVT